MLKHLLNEGGIVGSPWSNVGGLVGAFVGGSVGGIVGGLVGAFVGGSVGGAVGCPVGLGVIEGQSVDRHISMFEMACLLPFLSPVFNPDTDVAPLFPVKTKRLESSWALPDFTSTPKSFTPPWHVTEKAPEPSKEDTRQVAVSKKARHCGERGLLP